MWTSAMIDWDEVAKTAMMMWDGVLETLFMTLLSTLFGYILGLPIGITLAVTGNSGIRPNAKVYKVLDVIANMVLRFGQPINILRADTKNVEGIARGEMILSLPDDVQMQEDMKAYLIERGLAVEEVDGYVD